jgi:hypothetical protein
MPPAGSDGSARRRRPRTFHALGGTPSGAPNRIEHGGIAGRAVPELEPMNELRELSGDGAVRLSQLRARETHRASASILVSASSVGIV